MAATTGARITLTDSLDEGVAGVDFVHTDIWVSMGEPKDVWGERIALLRDYRVDADLMARAAPDAKFMHCLPAFLDRNTAVGEEIYRATGMDGLEVTDDVFDLAENRVHTIKAVMVATLGE